MSQRLEVDLRNESADLPATPETPEERFLRRKAEVGEHDHAEFVEYLQEKREHEKPPAPPQPPKTKVKVNRRNLLKVVAGTAVVGEAAALGYSVVKNQIPAHGAQHAGATYTEAQRHNIERELINPRADVGGRGFGSWVLLMPTKMGGGTYAVNLNTGRCLAWISYWPYGDFNPISHHLCAFPSADPAQGFEWVNSTQGGKNALIYGIPTSITTPGEGFNIYRVRYDGSQMEVMENVAETTGLGLGVHVTIDPRTAERYFVTDGQKDIAACFDRRTSRVIAALKYDWEPRDQNLAMGWRNGGTLTISKIHPDPTTGKYDYLGTKGQKIEWEMVPMGELFVEEGTLPGDDPHHLSGADGTIWHPSGRWASTVVRLCGGQVILDAENNFEPVAFLQFNKDMPDQFPVTRIDADHWQVRFDRIDSPGHEVGFSPDGRFLCMMNNLRENNCAVFDFERSRPAQLEKDRACRRPAVARQVSEPVPHGIFQGRVEIVPVDPASVAGAQRGHGGRHQYLDNQKGDPGDRAGHADPGDHL